MTGLLALLRVLGTPNLAELRKLGLEILKAEVRDRLSSQRMRITEKALERISGETDTIRSLTEKGPFTDPEGVSMTGKQYFVHQALYALIRVVVPSGGVADVIRD